MKQQYFTTNSTEVGLSSTSANHIANLAKEAYEKLEHQLDGTSFVRETITVIGSTAETNIKIPTPQVLTFAPTILKDICDLKSLIAWLREAIKEKERLFNENKQYQSQEYIDAVNARPQLGQYLTKEDVIQSWTVKEQEEYLSLETECAVVGKYIHPNGALSNARKYLSNRMNNPVSTECSGRDTIIRRYYADCNIQDVDDLFFELQKKHRDTQARLNGIKHKIDIAIREDANIKDEAYKKALEEYHQNLDRLRHQDKMYRDAKHKEIEALKIVIPNNLKNTYNSLARLGK